MFAREVVSLRGMRRARRRYAGGGGCGGMGWFRRGWGVAREWVRRSRKRQRLALARGMRRDGGDGDCIGFGGCAVGGRGGRVCDLVVQGVRIGWWDYASGDGMRVCEKCGAERR